MRAGVRLLAPLYAGLMASSAGAQTLVGSAAPEVGLWRVLGALTFCVLLAVGGAFALKLRLNPAAGGQMLSFPWLAGRLGLPPAQTRRLKAIESLRLTPQLEVSLFSCEGKTFLIAVSAAGQITVLDQAPNAGNAS